MTAARITRFCLLTCLALFLAQGNALASDDLSALLTPYLSSHAIPALAAAVAKDGKIVAAGAVGTRRAGENIPVTLNDRFHIGSDTKAMTALLAAMLVEEGKLRWDITPAEVFPELAAAMDPGFAKVTLTQLLSHCAGLPADNKEIAAVWDKAMDQPGNLDDMRLYALREWSKKPLASPAGTRFEYSNMGYMVAGAMIEHAAAKTWEEIIVERLFTPLHLTTAGLGCQSSLGRVDAPLGHVVAGGKTWPVLAGPNGDNPALLGPAGTAHLSILDFAAWGAFNAGEGRRGPALVKPETMRFLHTPAIKLTPAADAGPGTPQVEGGYALGWGVIKTDLAPHPLLQHSGSNTKNLAQIWVDVTRDLAIVVTANIGGDKASQALGAIARELYRKYAGAGGK